MNVLRLHTAAIAALGVLSASPALSGERKKSPGDDLPGVKVEQPLPLPEPGPEEAGAASSPTHFRVGNWDVRISGSLSYAVGFSSGGK